MSKQTSSNKTLITLGETLKCQKCGEPMKKVSWKVTAGAFDAGEEVEQTVFQCSVDKNFVSVEVSTGNPSEFAVDADISFTKRY